MYKRIIYIALNGNHHSLYLSHLYYLNSLNYEITVITRIENKNLLDYNKFNNIKNTLYALGDASDVILENLKLINSHEILIIDEFYGKYYNLFKINFKNEIKILFVHNVNKWLFNKLKIEFKHIIIAKFKQRYFNQFDAYITVGPNVQAYLKTFTSKSVFFFPFDGFIKAKKTKDLRKRDEIIISIPGSVSSARRYNLEILTTFYEYLSLAPISKIKIKFLGKLSIDKNIEIYNLINKINTLFGEKISFWETFIPINEYEQEVLKSDIILSNLRVINELDDRLEIYGLTKESGISFLIYKYSKPAIIPENQIVLESFNNQLLTYRSFCDLKEIFKNLDENALDFTEINQIAERNSYNFDLLIKNENKKFEKFINFKN